MSDNLLPVLVVLLVATGMAGGLLLVTHGLDWIRRSGTALARFIGELPKARIDETPYECGMQPFESVGKHRFSIHFYLVAMLFILFDIEAAFLYPWAVTFQEFAEDKLFVLGEMAVFLGILVAAFAYVWKRGALEWE